MSLSIIDMDFLYQFNLRLIAPLFTVSFHEMFEKKVFQDFQKWVGLWLVGKMNNHVGIYGSKVAEGFSAFQRRSCLSFVSTAMAQVIEILPYNVRLHRLRPKGQHGSILFNSLRPIAAYMHQQTKPTLVQIMACCLFGTKPLSEPMLIYCQLDPKWNINGNKHWLRT